LLLAHACNRITRGALGIMKRLAVDIGNEVDVQNGIIADLSKTTEDNTAKIKQAKEELQRHL